MHANAESRRPSSQVSRLVSNAGPFQLQRQTVPGPLNAQLTLRLRGVDSEPVNICYGFVQSWFGECLIGSQSAANRYARDNLETDGSNPPLHLCGTHFQLQVWSALLRIRPGHYLHYGDLAQQIGRPRAARAIGQAVGANGVSVLVPCHRVLAVGGRIGGYRWGSDLKLTLLQREALTTGRAANHFT
jgi:O-6-methylguanine DNA methyltransferase